MDDFVDKTKKDLIEIKNRIKTGSAQLVAKVTGKPAKATNTTTVMADSDATYEINLVPHVKLEMIKAQKIRNLVLFICILVSGIALGIVVMLFGVMSGQDVAIASQDARLDKLSAKLNEYAGLDDLVMIQTQLAKYAEIAKDKKMPSRVFGALGVMLSQGEDEIVLSNLSVDMQDNYIKIEGQADAKVEPLIDYRVLEAMKKSVDLLKYDFGRYVDVTGQNILTQCIVEADEEGNALKQGDSYYAWWDLTIAGCEGSLSAATADYEDTPYHYSSQAEVEYGYEGYEKRTREVCNEEGEDCTEEVYYVKEGMADVEIEIVEETEPATGEEVIDDEEIVEPVEEEKTEWTEEELKEELGDPQPMRVKIWRTPQFAKWFEDGFLQLNGTIVGIEHFNSECYTYKGADSLGSIKWTSVNTCQLVPGGLTISESSNARNDSGNLVLKFIASLEFDEEFFDFANKHMIAIGPMGQNVTDSYIQIGDMFAQEAIECDPEDQECSNASVNASGTNNTTGGTN